MRSALLLLVLSCTKSRPAEVRDPATLPHEDRPFPIVTSDIPLDASDTTVIRRCYDEALQRDATLGGTYTLTGHGTALEVKTGTLDERLRFCITSNFARSSSSRADIGLGLRAEMRHEPMRPGGVAADAEVRREITFDSVRVLRTELMSAFFDDFNGDVRTRDVQVSADVEITHEGVFTSCGSIRDFAPAESAVPCPKVHRAEGDVVKARGTVSFSLEPNGWTTSRAKSRHWFGDVSASSD